MCLEIKDHPICSGFHKSPVLRIEAETLKQREKHHGITPKKKQDGKPGRTTAEQPKFHARNCGPFRN
jgi:hypothetical protein